MKITPPPTKAGVDSFFMRDWMTKLQKVINDQADIDLSSPAPIGDVAPNTGKFTSLEYTTTFTGGTGTVTLGTNQFYKSAGGNIGMGTLTPDIFGAGYGKVLGITGASSTAVEINAATANAAVLDLGVNATRTATITTSSTTTNIGTITNTPVVLVSNNTAQMTMLAGNAVTLNGGTQTSGTGIAFPATQNASSNVNTLDDYEEGTWTPVLFATGATFNYTVQQGAYTKIGNSVTATCTITLAGSGNTLTANQLFIQNLPFTSANTSNQFFAGSLIWANFATSMLFATAQIAPNSTSIAVFKTTVAAISVANMNANDLSTTAGSTIQATITYFTA